MHISWANKCISILFQLPFKGKLGQIFFFIELKTTKKKSLNDEVDASDFLKVQIFFLRGSVIAVSRSFHKRFPLMTR